MPDLAIISAGVVTKAATATGAIPANAARWSGCARRFKRAGIEDRDIQTSSISLNPDYRYQENQPPQLTGYNAHRTRCASASATSRNAGKILDALVAEGANQINGPSLTIDKPEAALDEARAKAIAKGRARAELYARRAWHAGGPRRRGERERRSYPVPPPMPMMDGPWPPGGADRRSIRASKSSRSLWR